MKKYLIFGLILGFVACNSYKDALQTAYPTAWKVKRLPATSQNLAGNPEAGLDYLLHGDYIGSGIPYAVFKGGEQRIKKKFPYELEGKTDAPYFINVFEAYNGAKVVSGNCFTCHAAPIGDELLAGVGRYASDYRANLAMPNAIVKTFVRKRYDKGTKEREAFELISKYTDAISPMVELPQIGINPATRLAEACMQHRDPVDLTYRAELQYPAIDYNIASDVPPLWNVKKKNTLYYTGIGRGDFSKLLMQAVVLGIPDSTYARKVQERFVDVLAWLHTLEAPKYPYEIDQDLAAKGEVLFEEHCSKCHGTYGEEEIYPNKLVSVNLVKTDPLYADYAMDTKLHDWYNKSWFATTYPASSLIAEYGYIAPPLDGIWATAPYLHNASVPTLDDLLNSENRPTYWKRDWEKYDFDEAKVGWKYEAKNSGTGKYTFDTTIPGYGNQGHYFGDKLKTAERKAVIEYLKTL